MKLLISGDNCSALVMNNWMVENNIPVSNNALLVLKRRFKREFMYFLKVASHENASVHKNDHINSNNVYKNFLRANGITPEDDDPKFKQFWTLHGFRE